GENGPDRRDLDGGWLGVAGVAHGLQNLRGKIEFSERHWPGLSSDSAPGAPALIEFQTVEYRRTDGIALRLAIGPRAQAAIVFVRTSRRSVRPARSNFSC